MTLKSQLQEYKSTFQQKVPQDVQQTMSEATERLKQSRITDNAPKKGEKLLNFTLPNQTGKMQSLKELMQKGPVVVTFYRGGWCPYCNLELKAYQSHLSEIKETGATLVAITPELPDASLSTTEKNALEFEILSDKNAAYAKSIGLVFSLPEELRPVYEKFGIEIEKHNGKSQYNLPLAATFVVNQNGIIVSAFVDADYTQRQEPEEIITVLQSLSVSV